MRIALGTDHAGYAMKEAVKKHLGAAGHEIVDFGASDDGLSDYPVFVIPAAEAVASGEADRAVVFGGSGNGEAIAANKVRGIRCALCWSEETAELARRHNDANVLSLPGRLISPELALTLVERFLSTAYEGGRHDTRLDLIARYERK